MVKKLFAPVFHLRVSGITEGISFILLLGVAMPLKYMAGMPGAVKYLGWAHGILCIWYTIAVIWTRETVGLSLKDTAIALLASLLPFGTFYADKKIFRRLEEATA
jgi:integral membrane protein